MTMVLNPFRLSTRNNDFEEKLKTRLHWSKNINEAICTTVISILNEVEIRGDAAVLEYTKRFDHIKAESVAELEITKNELQVAFDALPEEQKKALEFCAERILNFHEKQKKVCGESWKYKDEYGNSFGQKVTPLDKVGIYVPGGRASYPSSVLMNAIPAHIAGVGEVIMVTPTPYGEKNKMVLAAAHLAGVHRIFCIGGAQAVAALAYGTETIPAVDKITGPGNAYVAEAKRRVFGKVGIDMIAGPSEILVLADGSAPAEWVAMDLFSQAEHDELAQSILLCPNADYIEQVIDAMTRLLPDMPQAETIAKSINGRGAFIHTQSMEESCDLANRIAPEHIEISSLEAKMWEPFLRHAGSIFLGILATESLGDYSAGPNHVLPTAGTARFSNPLGVYDFQKRTNLIDITPAGCAALAKPTEIMAIEEGLIAHARAAALRTTIKDMP